MKLTHTTTKDDVKNIMNVGFLINDNKDHFKPNGIWLSIDNDWERWCDANNFNQEKNEVILELKLHNQDKYWVIDSLDDFYAKFNEFCAAKRISHTTGSIHDIMLSRPFFDWVKSKGYHGVILTKQGQIQTHMKTFMYGWDCASICVFNPEDIEVIR